MNPNVSKMSWQFGLLTFFFLIIVANNIEHPVLRIWAMVICYIFFILQIATLFIHYFAKREKKEVKQ